MIRTPLILSAQALAASPSLALAGDLSGTVRDSAARPVEGVTVTIPDLGLSATTDAQGRYSFTDLAAGEHRIAVELASDVRQHASAQVPETGETVRNVFLYSRVAVDHARSGIDPVEAMLRVWNLVETRMLYLRLQQFSPEAAVSAMRRRAQP